MRRLLLALLPVGLALVAWALGCGRTVTLGQVMVVVDSDLAIPGEWDTLGMRIAVRGEPRLDQRYTVGPTNLTIPASLDLVQGSDTSTPVTVTVVAFKGTKLLVTQQFVTTIPPERVVTMRMTLNRACEGVVCLPEQTCSDGVCVAQAVDSSALPDFGSPPAASGDASAPRPDVSTPPPDASTQGAVYSELASLANWSAFDPTTLDANARDFAGAVFDGRYVYLVPSNNLQAEHIVARFDTQAAFGAAGWSLFDTLSVHAAARGFAGGAFDGRYVYFVPNHNGAPAGLVVRYDSRAPFSAVGSWSSFDTATVDANAAGFVGAVFDGRYLYFVPFLNRVGFDGLVARYDTQAPFAAPGSWSMFDMAAVSPGAVGFHGGLFDGRYVYFVPHLGAAPSGVVARYDTQGAFGVTGSWSVFDAAALSPGARGFAGGVFDGRYVYLVPGDNGSASGLAARYDTQAPFASAGSWTLFDTATVRAGAKGFFGGAFDGRYVYLLPYYDTAPHGLLTRYDTRAPFTAAASWTVFDAATVSPGAVAFQGAAFDGRYLHLVPNLGTAVVRFDARSPPAMPALPAFFGSFL